MSEWPRDDLDRLAQSWGWTERDQERLMRWRHWRRWLRRRGLPVPAFMLPRTTSIRNHPTEEADRA